LLKYIGEFGKHVSITGFRNANIKNVEEFLKIIRKEKTADVEIQFFDAELVATWQHLYFAVLNALTAFKNKRNISKSLTMEIMIYASAQHQIRKATELLGIKPATSNIAVLMIAGKAEDMKLALSTVLKHVKAQKDDTVLEMSVEKEKIIQNTFGISDLELETVMKGNNLEKTLVDLVIERMALLAIQR
jgi:KEOPS complex subunit Cgi121